MMLACALAAVVAGCASERGDDEGVEAGFSSAGGQSAWTLERHSSHMDGDVLAAVRLFEFPNRRSTFVANVSCRLKTKYVPIWVESYVGDPANPEPESAFATALQLNMLRNMQDWLPQGRVKLPGQDPSGLWPTFVLDSGFNNRLNIYDLFLEGTELFPMVLEVNNGLGAFELVLDASPELRQVLEACDQGARVAGRRAEAALPLPVANSPSTAAQSRPAAAASIAAPEQSRPSFDCGEAATTVERLICKEPLLGRLDAALAANYSAMRAADIGDGARRDLQATQREWMQTRNRCTDAECIEVAYRARVDSVCEYPVHSGVHPDCVTASDIMLR